MSNLINSPENELRVRIKNGFESGRSSKKIVERPKTPRFINKDSTSGIKPKQSKTAELQQEIPVLKNKDISKQTKTSKKELDNIPVYICYKCDKTYKSKRGIIKHMEKCTDGKSHTKKIIT